MFQKEYTFYGSHADKVAALTKNFTDEAGSRIFQRNFDVLIFAPIVGLLYGKKSEVDKTSKSTAKILADIMMREDLKIKYNYKLITLLDKNSQNNNRERIDKAFRYIGEDEVEEEMENFNSYILGGVDILYEKLIEPVKEEQDYLECLYDFLDDIRERYNEAISDDHLKDLINLARS